MPTHFVTVYKLPHWAKREINRYRRSFLWRGEDPDKVCGGQCLVKWAVCTWPKKWGGLGIKDLENFGRVLRLRWMWFKWDELDMPWKHMLQHHDSTDRALFFASTVITVGNGKNTPFWEARWLNGVSPRELAPNLYNQAHFKHRTVHKELQQWNWVKNLKRIDTEELLDEFILLFSMLSDVQLSDDRDVIAWRWSSNGEYTASSAYQAQFLGAFPLFRASTIWRARTEPKCCFFTWLAMQGKAPTTDNLMKKHYPRDPICPLCFSEPETNDHLHTECNYTEAVWDRVATSLQVHQSLIPFQKGNVSSWIAALGQAGSKQQQRENAGVVLFFWWCIWKERNSRIFDSKDASFLQTADQIKVAVRMYDRAFASS
jgi:hypothetical protein